MPRCKRCGLEHFNFQACETAQAQAELARRRDVAPRQVLRVREGWRDFGNVTYAYTASGNKSLIPRSQHPAYEPPVRPQVEARDLTPPRFSEE